MEVFFANGTIVPTISGAEGHTHLLPAEHGGIFKFDYRKEKKIGAFRKLSSPVHGTDRTQDV